MACGCRRSRSPRSEASRCPRCCALRCTTTSRGADDESEVTSHPRDRRPTGARWVQSVRPRGRSLRSMRAGRRGPLRLGRHLRLRSTRPGADKQRGRDIRGGLVRLGHERSEGRDQARLHLSARTQRRRLEARQPGPGIGAIMNTDESSIEQLLLGQAERQTALLHSIDKTLWWLLILVLSLLAGFLTWTTLVGA